MGIKEYAGVRLMKQNVCIGATRTNRLATETSGESAIYAREAIIGIHDIGFGTLVARLRRADGRLSHSA